MPVRIGFTKFREQMLEQELETIQALLPTLGVEKVILSGDMVSGDYSPESKIRLVICLLYTLTLPTILRV